MHKYIFYSFLFLATVSCTSEKLDLQVVEEFEINKYLGTWYEIARLPNNFEDGLKCIKAEYSMKSNGDIEVINSGVKVGKTEKLKDINGTAWIPNSDEPAKLKVRFFWPSSADYWVLYIDGNYEYALVGGPSGKFLWVLSRSKKLDQKIINKLLIKAKESGFNINDIVYVNQDC